MPLHTYTHSFPQTAKHADARTMQKRRTRGLAPNMHHVRPPPLLRRRKLNKAKTALALNSQLSVGCCGNQVTITSNWANGLNPETK